MSPKMTPKQRDDADIQDRIDLAVVKADIAYIKNSVQDMNFKLSSNYITKEEFSPVKKVVYGLVALILTLVGGAIINLAIQK